MSNIINIIGSKVSATAESYMHARTQSAARLRVVLTGMALGALFVFSTSGIAEASSGLSGYATKASGNTNIIVDIVSYMSYIGGAILSAVGVIDLKKHVESPGQNPLKNGLAKLGFGGVLLALPFVSKVMADTMAGDSPNTGATFQTFSSRPTIGN